MDGSPIHEVNTIPQDLMGFTAGFTYLTFSICNWVLLLFYVCSADLIGFILSFERREDGFHLHISPDPNTNLTYRMHSVDVFKAVLEQNLYLIYVC